MEINTYKNTLINLLKKIRKPMEDMRSDVEETYLYFEKTLLPPIESNGYEKNYTMPFLILVTNPCSHLLKSGGCTMCGYSNLANFEYKVTGDLIYEQFRRGFNIIEMLPRHEMVAIGTAGSFLDPHEVPFDIQGKIIKDLDSSDDFYYINIEARAEHVTEDALKNILEVVDYPYKLSIGVGLESSNDLIRELCVNKNLTLESFSRAITLLNKYDISPTVYVTVGKPFIGDWTNIKDAVDSIKYAFQQGADRVVLLRVGIQPNSLIEWLYRNGLYSPIDIWAVGEVIKRLPEDLRKNVLLANPRLPKHMEVEDCPCSQTAMELLNEYKGTLDYHYIKAMDIISCPHKDEWYENLRAGMESGSSLRSQISEGYQHWLEVWENKYR